LAAMKRPLSTARLMMGLCLAAPLLMAQNQAIDSERQNAEKRLETANELQKLYWSGPHF
jgi:hypothetical protein